MRPDLRIQREGISTSQRGIGTPQGEHPTGIWNGQSVRLAPAKDVDDAIRIVRFKSENNLDSGIEKKSLSQRKVGLDQERRLSEMEINSYTKAVSSQKRTAEIATQYFRYLQRSITSNSDIDQPHNEKPKRDAGVQSLMQHYLGLHKLALGLKGNDDKLLAMLSPLQEQADGLEDIARQMQEAGEDREKLGKLLADVEGCQIDQESLFQLLRETRYRPKELSQFLRNALRLPSLSRDQREALLEKTEDALREFERTDGSRIRASLNSHQSASESSDAENFIEGYNELIENNGGFAKSLENLLSRFKPAEISKVLPLLKQAIGEDLNSELRSTDKVKLEFLLSELAYMQIMSTVINMIGNLASGMHRLYSDPRIS
jgi:hypothetical protein